MSGYSSLLILEIAYKLYLRLELAWVYIRSIICVLRYGKLECCICEKKMYPHTENKTFNIAQGDILWFCNECRQYNQKMIKIDETMKKIDMLAAGRTENEQ